MAQIKNVTLMKFLSQEVLMAVSNLCIRIASPWVQMWQPTDALSQSEIIGGVAVYSETSQ